MDYKSFDKYKIEVRKNENKKFLRILRQRLINKNIPFNIKKFEVLINECKKILFFNIIRINLKSFLKLLREIRKMTNYNGFKLSTFILDNKLKLTIKKILSLKQNTKIINEITLILINFFDEENFRVLFQRDFFEDYNFLIEKCDFSILVNLFKILKKINFKSSDLILENFDIKLILTRFKKSYNEFNLSICMQINIFIEEIIKKMKDPNVYKLKILIKFRKNIFFFMLNKTTNHYLTHKIFLEFIEILLIKINFKIKDDVIFYLKDLDLFPIFFNFVELSFINNFEKIGIFFKILINILTKCDNIIFLKKFFFSFKNEFLLLMKLFENKKVLKKIDFLLIIYGNLILTDEDICKFLFKNKIYHYLIYLSQNQNKYKLEILFVLEALLIKLDYKSKKKLFFKTDNILKLIFSLFYDKIDLECIFKLFSILEIIVNYKNDIFNILNIVKFNDNYQKIIKEITFFNEVDEKIYIKFLK